MPRVLIMKGQQQSTLSALFSSPKENWCREQGFPWTGMTAQDEPRLKDPLHQMMFKLRWGQAS